MINGVIVKSIGKFEDERGWLSEIYRRDGVDLTPAMSYVSLTLPQVVRGPHEHVYQSDFFIFIGPGRFSLHLWDRREGSSTKGEKMELEVGEGNPCSVVVPPGVVHGYKCISDVPALSINMPDKLYKGVMKQDEIDEIRWELDQESPYKI